MDEAMHKLYQDEEKTASSFYLFILVSNDLKIP